MRFIIKNIGTISQATIELNNLTIISGENNSGKTTISKIIYAIGQASSSFPIDYKRHQYNEFRRLYDELAINIHRLVRSSEKLSADSNVDELMSTLMDIRRSSEVTEFDFSITTKLIEKITHNLNEEEAKSSWMRRTQTILNRLEIFYNDYNYNDPIDKFIYRALKNEFSDEILNKKNNAEEAYLALYEENILIFEITFNDKKIINFNAEYNKLPIKDSTLIEGPYIFQLASIIHDMTFRDSINRRNSRINPKIPYHILGRIQT